MLIFCLTNHGKIWESLNLYILQYSCGWQTNTAFFQPDNELENVEVNLVGVNTYADFEVISILGDRDPYPALLGIDWAYDNYGIIDLKKETMTFEYEGTRVIQPLDPYKGLWYTKPANDNMEMESLENIYHLTIGKWSYYINPIDIIQHVLPKGVIDGLYISLALVQIEWLHHPSAFGL
uniref:Uncharacterized protein n=1 Tax=Picea glauca TaxID=3330 RepID=A0A101LVQ5_PICGL|nr:hypothetical protein ABT39_MTgene1730 [Picea glauca]KUM48740.1 hypothetical protein ABT39_MTgene4755 [Picea glauca]